MLKLCSSFPRKWVIHKINYSIFQGVIQFFIYAYLSRKVQSHSLDGTYMESTTSRSSVATAKSQLPPIQQEKQQSDSVLQQQQQQQQQNDSLLSTGSTTDGPPGRPFKHKAPPADLPLPLVPGYRTCCPGGCISMEVLHSASRGSGVVNQICM